MIQEIHLLPSETQLFQIEQTERIHRGKTTTRFQLVNHNSVLQNILKKRVDCTVVFKGCDVLVSREFRARGRCKDCEAEVKVCSENNHKTLLIYRGDAQKLHTYDKKRRIDSVLRDELVIELEKSSAYNIQTELANNEVEERCAQIPSLNALRILKHKHLKRKRLDSMPTMAVRKMFYSPKMKKAIKAVATDPFHVFYWTQHQVAWLTHYKKNERVVLSIDATGSIVRPINLAAEVGVHNLQSPSIFLYLITATTQSGASVPVCQMLSADQHSR